MARSTYRRLMRSTADWFLLASGRDSNYGRGGLADRSARHLRLRWTL
jgi:hypothetical protein